MQQTISIIGYIILIYFIILTSGYIILLIASFPDISRAFKEATVGRVEYFFNRMISPPVTIIIPVYNEEKHVINSIYSLLRNNYPSIDIILVDDGSTDETFDLLFKEFDLKPVTPSIPKNVKSSDAQELYVSKKNSNLTLIRKQHARKSDSLNIGVNACRTPIFITMDADSIMQPEGISQIVFSMLSHAHSIAVGGGVYVLNGCKIENGQVISIKIPRSLTVGIQIAEYLRAFLFGRAGWNLFGGALCMPGTLTLFERETVVEVGGFEDKNIAQDEEIIIHLNEYMLRNKKKFKIRYTPNSAVWTNVPNHFWALVKQRWKWQYWTMHSMLKHIRMLFNPRYGRVGLVTYPFYLFGELFGSVVETISWIFVLLAYLYGFLNVYYLILYVLVAWGVVTLLTMATALLNVISFNEYKNYKDTFLILLLVIVENAGCRQVLSFFRCGATFHYLFVLIMKSIRRPN